MFQMFQQAGLFQQGPKPLPDFQASFQSGVIVTGRYKRELDGGTQVVVFRPLWEAANTD
jgi:hypothetical protein